ncbi:hypothetical protein EZS27_007955 [termite gut metagenome]|uniref:Uncharacterized protein n=1 Tax=termite gut metagenome TaxID=433724 RepID=A0A5J4SF71_9ZZZZ
MFVSMLIYYKAYGLIINFFDPSNNKMMSYQAILKEMTEKRAESN